METIAELGQALHNQLQQQRQSLQEVEALLEHNATDQEITQVEELPSVSVLMLEARHITIVNALNMIP